MFRQPDGSYQAGTEAQVEGSGTSIFDPVMCELCYSWFTAPGAAILDPFAGGSVRGIVASILGRSYIGIDLRPEQVAANEQQGVQICAGYEFPPRWICGDSAHVEMGDGEFDFIFSCPPYGDLEVYSDDPRDLSAMAHNAFVDAYRGIIARAVRALRSDRFAAFVVGDFRDASGFYRNFVGDTIAAFQDAGAKLYNEAILVTAVGSLPVRINGQWNASRKLGKTHQNLLVFCKGDPRKAAKWINAEAPPEQSAATPTAPDEPAPTPEAEDPELPIAADPVVEERPKREVKPCEFCARNSLGMFDSNCQGCVDREAALYPPTKPIPTEAPKSADLFT
jgi:hypothetical protein